MWPVKAKASLLLLAAVLAAVFPDVSAVEAGSAGQGGGGGGEGGGYWSLQLSPNSISTVPFRGRHISVWEHATDKGRYVPNHQRLVCKMEDQLE